MKTRHGRASFVARVPAVGFTAVVVAIAGCSLVVSTSDLTGGVACAGSACNGATDAAIDSAAVVVDACAADVKTDSKNCGACGHACASASFCSDGQCAAGCPGGVLYVSTNGSDASNGCTLKAPKKTIASALAFLRTAKAHGQAVHVCGGTYTEPALTMDFPVSLLGGYDCVAWVRSATYGYPTFDTLNRTTIAPDPLNFTGTTLSIEGLGQTGVATFDGFTVSAPLTTLAASESEAVYIYGGGLPVISNDVISGSSTDGPTYGVYVSYGSDAEITHDTINGGGGKVESNAIHLDAAALARIHDNSIDGGSSAFSSSIGIQIDGCAGLTGDHAVKNNVITGGNGTSDGSNPASLAIQMSGASRVDIVGNTINGGTGRCSFGACEIAGVYLFDTGTFATVADNRIEAGNSTGGTNQLVEGVVVSELAQASLVSNAIHALGTTAMQTAFAVNVESSTNVAVEENTLYGTTAAIQVLASSDVVATNNLLLGESSFGSIGLWRNGCVAPKGVALAPATASSLRDNAFVGFGASPVRVDISTNGTCTTSTSSTVAAYEAAFSGSASENRRLASDCSGEDSSRCVVTAACPIDATSGSSCIESVLATWDDATQGGVDLVDDTRTWHLASSVSCGIAQGGNAVDLPDSASTVFASDILGKPRTPPFSLGAYESDLGCTN